MKVGVTYIRDDKLRPYTEAVRRAGLDPVPISPAAATTLKGLAGLVLTGGGDVDPALYGEHAGDRIEHVSRERDDLEISLIQEAYARDLPVLGICRGLQILNVARGGTLLQHVDGHKNVEHGVAAVPESTLAVCIGADEYTVNSRHHQAIGRVAPDLVVTAMSADGIIEAVEDPERRFVLAVQWHPEDRVDDQVRDLRIFRAFASEVKR
ncbi:MAG TPA: type 1 glutamine amidotransferase [Bryobacteraceae bacterium]|nr:type 1 glutamine amidotransferase [Bryobacteraceae bacterium]